jgi:hypothetical protein
MLTGFGGDGECLGERHAPLLQFSQGLKEVPCC